MTYRSGGKCTKVDYIPHRSVSLKEIRDCEGVTGESGARQHMVVCQKQEDSEGRSEEEVHKGGLKIKGS